MKFSVFFYIILTFFVFSCNSKSEKPDETMIIPAEETTPISSDHCYLFSNGKDSIRLSFQQKGNEIKGWMNYDFYEKDGSIGEIEGEAFGDTLKLEYKFLAEGTLSEQEVYFLKKDNYKLYRGSGEMKMTNDSILVYSNPNEIKFSDYTPLSELKNCPEGFINEAYILIYTSNLKEFEISN